MAALIQSTGIAFVDAAIMDAVPFHGHRVPILAAGPGSQEFAERLRPYGMHNQILEAPAGAATAVKRVRSIFTKGMAAVAIETLVAARRFQVTDLVMTSLINTMEAPFGALVERFVTGTIRHAERRAGEMEEVVGMLAEEGFQPVMALATRAFLARMTGAMGVSAVYDDALAIAAVVLTQEKRE